MSSFLDHGLIRTAAAEQVVAPIAAHLCHLVLLCDSADEPEQFSRLEGAAQAVARATENMATVASRKIRETEDETLHMEMSSLLETVSVSGQHVLLAAQKLHIQPCLTEHREELITATQNVFLGVVKVLLVEDDATVRRVIAAADGVLESLSELGSSSHIESLLKSFQVFSQALLLLNRLTVDRANSLQDPEQAKQLFGSLETLRRCISMLHTAMCTTIKHPTSEQAQAAKSYILDKVQDTVGDIVVTLKSEGHSGSLGACGYYTERRNCLLQLLTNSLRSSVRSRGFDSLVRDLVFHSMAVANSSRRESQQRVVTHCRHILQLWSDIKKVLKSSANLSESELRLEKPCTLLVQQIQMLDGALWTAVLYQVLDTFLTAPSTVKEILRMTRQVLVANSPVDEMDLNFIQPVVEDLISSTDQIIQVANFISAVAVDAKSLESMENSLAGLTRLRGRLAPLSLELADNSAQTLQKLHEACRKWEEEAAQLQDTLSDVMDVREFTSVAIDEMVNDRQGCDAAYREQSYELLNEQAANLTCHMKLVTQAVRRHLDRSDNPIYRNGLLVLLRQAQASQAAVLDSVRDMLSGSRINVEAYSTFSQYVSTALQHFKVLRQGLDGEQHPHLLSPLRAEVRQPDVPQPGRDTSELTLDRVKTRFHSPVLELMERDSQLEYVEEHSDEETIEAEPAHKYDSGDLKTPAVSEGPRPIREPLGFDLLPLLYEVVAVTKGKDVTALNRACTGVLEISNCYAQAAKEALVAVDAVDGQTLESFRAELVSLTPLLVQTAQETAMSSAMSTESIYKHSTQFSDLINNTRKVLLPVAGSWYHAVHTELRGNPAVAASVRQQLNEVMTLCTDVVQLLTSSDLSPSSDGQETFSLLHNKLNKVQNHTRCLVEFSSSQQGQSDQLEGLCLLWGLSVQILLNSLDKLLGMSTAVNQLRPRKQISVLSESSLRVQEAARLTSLTCKSAYRSKQLTGYQEELKTLTEAYLKASEELDITPTVIQLAKAEFYQRHLLIKIRVLSGHLSKANKDYDTALQGIVSIAYSAAEHFRENNTEEAEQQFENAAQTLFESVKLVAKRVEDSLNYIRDPRARSNLRAINDHLSFQISDIISRARLVLDTHYICDTLGLEVQIQSWSAKAHYVAEEIRKQDGIHQEAKEHIRACLQGRTAEDIKEVLPTIAPKVKEVEYPSDTSWKRGVPESVVAAEQSVEFGAVAKHKLGATEKCDVAGSLSLKETSCLTNTSLYLKQESDSWDPKDNRIVQVTRKMADTICYMTQYLRKKGPIPNKEAFVCAAKDVISDCQSVTQFIRVITNHCLDKQCTVELSLIVEQILTITNQLSIISSVKAVTPGCKSSDEILVQNAQNLLQTVLRGVHAAETACMTGLKQPEPDSDGAEATALCFQWRRKLEIHRAQQTLNPETDELGLRKTSSHPDPSLAAPLKVTTSLSKHK